MGQKFKFLFNKSCNEIAAEQIRITNELNQIKSTISPNEIETQAIVVRREIERGLKEVRSNFKKNPNCLLQMNKKRYKYK